MNDLRLPDLRAGRTELSECRQDRAPFICTRNDTVDFFIGVVW